MRSIAGGELTDPFHIIISYAEGVTGGCFMFLVQHRIGYDYNNTFSILIFYFPEVNNYNIITFPK